MKKRALFKLLAAEGDPGPEPPPKSPARRLRAPQPPCVCKGRWVCAWCLYVAGKPRKGAA